MKKTSHMFEKVREYLQSAEFVNVCRMKETDFVRTRWISCQALVLFILNLLRKSIATELIGFIKSVPIRAVTRSAITKARRKLSPQAFVCLNNVLLREFYTENPVNTFCGYILAGIDGSTLTLPANSPEINKRYGGATNQTDQIVPMARTSVLYDVINGVTIDAIIAPYCHAERDMVFQHIDNLKKHQSLEKNPHEFLLLFDRGYPSVPLIIYLLKQGMHFLMRCNGKFIAEVDAAVASGKRDAIIEFNVKRAGAAKKLMQKLFPVLNKKEKVRLRVIVVVLKTGEKEVLLTSLLDQEKYPYAMFYDLYFKRCGVEENYKFLKIHLSIENFSGKSCLAIEQDFHATVLASNAYALLALEAQEELGLGTDFRKYKYKINRNVGVFVLKNALTEVLMNSEVCLEAFCDKIKRTMKSNLVPIRPGRRFHRRRSILSASGI